MNDLLQVSDLYKSFVEGGEEIHILQGLNLELGVADRLAIIGESGVGKSTLLHILGTLDRPTKGQIFYRGKNLATLREEELAIFRNREIGFVFQFHYLLPDFSALENVMLPALIQGWEWRNAQQQAQDLLEQVGLGDRLSHRPGKLSGGEQQRVAVARALILNPALVLADEPTGNLDPQTGEEIQHLLLDLNEKRGVGLIVATHNQQLASEVGNQMLLQEGRLLAI